MDAKNRLIIAISITCLIVIAMFASFGRTLFLSNIPSVSLPQADGSQSDTSGDSSQTDPDQYWLVNATSETVQSIISTLTRPDSYYRELTVESFWNEGSSSVTVQFWQDGGWSHTRQTLASGAVRHDLTGSDTWYYWYEGSQTWASFPAGDYSSDLSQRIPTYETVLELPQEDITQAGYEEKAGYACVFVAFALDEGDVQRYWISTDNGLLVCAEREVDGQLVYRMTASSAIQSPCPSTASFALPDGTKLHAPSAQPAAE